MLTSNDPGFRNKKFSGEQLLWLMYIDIMIEQLLLIDIFHYTQMEIALKLQS